MNIVNASGIELLTLLGGPFYAELSGFFIVLTFHRLLSQLLRHIAMESLRDLCYLREFAKRLDARHDRNCDTHLPRAFHKSKIFAVVVEELCDSIFSPKVLFLLEMLHVHLYVWRFLMFLGIGSYAIMEFGARMLHRTAISKEALIETVHLTDKLRGMIPPSGSSSEHTVFLGFVAPKEQDVADAKKLQVDELIFYIFFCSSRADNVRNDRNIISPLDGGSNGDGTRTTAHTETLILSFGDLAVDIFRVMGRDIDIVRTKVL